MEERLLQHLKKRYRIVLISMMVLLGIAVFWLLAVLLTYADVMELVDMKDGTEIKAQVICAALLLGALIAGTVTLVPYRTDIVLLRKHEYRLIEATFVRYDYQLSHDEDSRLHAVPLFQDTLTKEILTFPLDEKDLESLGRDVCYRIAYLPNTRIAVVEKNK